MCVCPSLCAGVWATQLIPKGKRFGPFVGEKKKRSQVTSNVYMWEVGYKCEPHVRSPWRRAPLSYSHRVRHSASLSAGRLCVDCVGDEKKTSVFCSVERC